ncbi:MAG: hypothetical protein LLG44_12205 [Chloroflexi bacterium]|nr:hypothetical protein [Chloroflexota bacterium]
MKRAALLVARISMALQGALYLGFAIDRLLGASSAGGMGRLVLALLLFANSAAFCVLAYLAPRYARWLQILTLAFLAVNLALSLTDQVGFWDYLVFALNFVGMGGYVGYQRAAGREDRMK